MVFSQSLPAYRVKQIRQNGTQCYVNDRGLCLPSVTTILNATRSPEQREALNRWRQRVGTEVAAEITSRASRRGTGTHKHIQRYLQGEAVVCPDGIRPYWESIRPVLQAVDEVRLVEGVVFHEDLGYAGIVDCVARYQEVPCVCEWKTADRPRQTLDRLNDYPLQVAAYWGATNHCYREHTRAIDHALLAIALPDLPAEVFWLDRAAIEEYWSAWQERVARYWRRQGGYGRWE